jgi:hypothetical protein
VKAEAIGADATGGHIPCRIPKGKQECGQAAALGRAMLARELTAKLAAEAQNLLRRLAAQRLVARKDALL